VANTLPLAVKGLSYSAVKLFSKYSNLCDHGACTSRRDRQTDGRTDDMLWHNRGLRSIARYKCSVETHLQSAGMQWASRCHAWSFTRCPTQLNAVDAGACLFYDYHACLSSASSPRFVCAYSSWSCCHKSQRN